jgi:hypothetical protein
LANGSIDMAAVIPLKEARAPKSKEVSKPYEPTAREAEVLASYESRQAKKKPAPGVKVTMSEVDATAHAKIEVDHPDIDVGYRLLSESIGTDDRNFVIGTLNSLGMAAQEAKRVDQGTLNYALAMVRGVEPKDLVEVTLGVQMAAIHLATMNAAARLNGSRTPQMWDAHERALNRLARTFTTQVEALKRYRSKGEQRVYVERVTVNEGGQAIVGPVSHGGRDGGGKENGS